MNPKLWLFYPENDIALAHGNANFTAPPAAVALRRACEILPLWMAGPCDRVMCSGINEHWLDSVQSTFAIGADVWNHTDFDLYPSPWGWSAASRRFYADNGFAASALPDDGSLELWRRLSHRRTAAEISSELSAVPGLDICPAAVEITDVAVLKRMIEQSGQIVVKSPWSSSGRGVSVADRPHVDEALRRAAGTIRRQGSVMAEEYAGRRFEFALLFMCEGGCAKFKGYSLFRSASGGYEGNVVAPDDYMRDVISNHLSLDKLDTLTDALSHSLTCIVAGGYSGPVGADLCIVEGTPTRQIHLMEINLRYTMGFLAAGLARYVAAPSMFTIIKGLRGAEYGQPVITNGLLEHGTLSLTPPGTVFSPVLTVI